MSRLRVLHCIYDDPGNPWVGGGGAHRVLELYGRLTDRIEATVLTGRYPGARDQRREGVEYRFRGIARPYPLSRLTYGLAATRALRTGDFDVGVVDFSVYSPVRAPAERAIGHVVHMPIGPTVRGRFGALLGGMVDRRERRMLRRAQRIQTTSHWMESRLRPIATTGSRIDIVGSGVDDVFFEVSPGEPSHLLFYGRLDYYQKGLDTLLEAYGRMTTEVPDPPQLVIAGRGNRTRVEEAAAAAGLEGVRVEAPVSRDRVLELLSGALMLLMPSRFEGLPVVPMEAMAANVPVVASAVGGLGEIVEEGRTGLLLPSEEPVALAEAVISLLRDPTRRHQMARDAGAAARAFRWNAIADDHYAWLRSLIDG